MDMNKNIELNRTHAKQTLSFEESIENLKKKILLRGDLPHVTCKFQLELIEQLCNFPLGRFILERRGTNGFWTDYIISHPTCGRISGLNIEGVPFTPLEDWFLNQCPIIVAHQERFNIFQKLTQNLLKDHITLASIPCGLMRDLITLDFSSVTYFELLGIDIDPESLSLAKQLAHQKGIVNIRLIQKNAWELAMQQEIDVITSSGLNVYEPDRKKVLDLYKQLFIALRPGGHLIISALTYPPGEEKETDWNTINIPQGTLLLDQIIHRDILNITWRNFRLSSELEEEFKLVGFSNISVHFDKHRIFPTILAKKPL